MAKRSDVQKEVGSRIRERRRSLGWSQEVLAHRAGMHTKAIGRIEAGHSNVTVTTLHKLAKAFGVEPGDFFSRSARKETAAIAELHRIVDDAKGPVEDLMLYLLRAVAAWQSQRAK